MNDRAAPRRSRNCAPLKFAAQVKGNNAYFISGIPILCCGSVRSMINLRGAISYEFGFCRCTFGITRIGAFETVFIGSKIVSIGDPIEDFGDWRRLRRLGDRRLSCGHRASGDLH